MILNITLVAPSVKHVALRKINRRISYITEKSKMIF